MPLLNLGPQRHRYTVYTINVDLYSNSVFTLNQQKTFLTEAVIKINDMWSASVSSGKDSFSSGVALWAVRKGTLLLFPF